jgi:uncharacterized protein YgfB (UPF0149 family)
LPGVNWKLSRQPAGVAITGPRLIGSLSGSISGGRGALSQLEKVSRPAEILVADIRI